MQEYQEEDEEAALRKALALSTKKVSFAATLILVLSSGVEEG